MIMCNCRGIFLTKFIHRIQCWIISHNDGSFVRDDKSAVRMILGVDCVNLIRIYEEHKPVANTVPWHKHNDIYAGAGRTTECN